METIPSYLTSPEEALSKAAGLEEALLAAADAALVEFLDRVVNDTLTGNLTRGNVLANWKAALAKRLSHPSFYSIRDELLAQLGDSQFDDDVFTAGSMALEVAHNMGATPEEKRELVESLFAHPKPTGLVAALSERVDGWLRRRISKALVNRIRSLGAEDLTRGDLVGREYEIPEAPGSSTLVTEDDWSEDDRPGEINWRARMRRDIRTAYTAIFGRQMHKQLEKYGFTEKAWVSRKDDRVRVSHHAADGQAVPIYDSFRVGLSSLRFPGDPTGPIGETVYCRCVLVGVGSPRI